MKNIIYEESGEDSLLPTLQHLLNELIPMIKPYIDIILLVIMFYMLYSGVFLIPKINQFMEPKKINDGDFLSLSICGLIDDVHCYILHCLYKKT